MVDHTWLTIMMGVILLVIVLGILTSIALLIFAIVEMKRMSALISRTISYTERLDPLVQESEKLVRSMSKIAEDAGAVTHAARNISEAGNDVLINLKALSIILNGLAEGLTLKVCGVKAGMKTALGVLITQLKERRSHHE